MGRIIAHVSVKNIFNLESAVHCNAPVDTGSAYMAFPAIWMERFGKLNSI